LALIPNSIPPSEARIVPKSHAAKSRPIVTVRGSAGEVAVDENVTRFSSGDIELLLALKSSMEQLETGSSGVVWGIESFPQSLRKIVYRSQIVIAVRSAIDGSSDLRRFLLPFR